MSLKKRLEFIRKKILLAASKVNRNINEIKPIWVTKTIAPTIIQELFSLGEKTIGENKAQELANKILPNFKGDNYECHFIGHLQSNKIKTVIPNSHYVHSLDKFSLAEKINSFLAKNDRVISPKFFIEVNTSGEANKGGLLPNQLSNFIDKLNQLPHLKVVGLMTMAPFTENKKVIRECFKKLKDLRDQALGKSNQSHLIKELSMGMSNDFEIAIEEGATVVRIGSLLFGKRE